MTQCEKTLDNGERCSNRAVPGARFCERHRRIQFRPVDKATEPDLLPVAQEVAAPVIARASGEATGPLPSTPSRIGPVALPSAGGQEPAFPGLRADARNVLVGAEALVWVPAADERAGGVGARLVRLLCLLSASLDLAASARVWRSGVSGDALVHLPLPTARDDKASVLFDAVAAAAAARDVRGLTFVGEGRRFIRYRTHAAPRGFDADGVAPADGGDWLLVTESGGRLLPTAGLQEADLGELLLDGAVPLPDGGAVAPERLWVLAPTALYAILAKYFRAHRLRFDLARLTRSGSVSDSLCATTRVLFALSPMPGAPAGALVPRFVMDYLTRLPLVALLVAAFDDRGRQLLVQWGHRLPFDPTNVAAAFGEDELLLFTAGQGGNRRCAPRPGFIDGDRLTVATTTSQVAEQLAPDPAGPRGRLTLPLRLLPDPGPTQPTAALVLSAKELEWLRRLLYRLPAGTFGQLALYPSVQSAVLLARAGPIEGIPFGEPLRRLGEGDLFIPLRQRFVPELPWPLLRETLGLRDGVLTLITATRRLDLAADAFLPLSRALLTEPGRPRLDLALRETRLPTLDWEPLPEPEPEPREQPRRRPGWLPWSRPDAPPPERGGATAPAEIDWKERAAAFE